MEKNVYSHSGLAADYFEDREVDLIPDSSRAMQYNTPDDLCLPFCFEFLKVLPQGQVKWCISLFPAQGRQRHTDLCAFDGGLYQGTYTVKEAIVKECCSCDSSQNAREIS